MSACCCCVCVCVCVCMCVRECVCEPVCVRAHMCWLYRPFSVCPCASAAAMRVNALFWRATPRKKYAHARKCSFGSLVTKVIRLMASSTHLSFNIRTPLASSHPWDPASMSLLYLRSAEFLLDDRPHLSGTIQSSRTDLTDIMR
jgi:hypothetical protein